MNKNSQHPEDDDSNLDQSHCSKHCHCSQGNKDFRNSDWFALLVFTALVAAIVILTLCFW